MQPIADLRLLELAQISVDRHQAARRPRRRRARPTRDGSPSSRSRSAARAAVRISRRKQLRARRIERERLVVLVDQPLEIAQRAVALGARQRRHQVVDDHRLRPALGLRALARVVDDERIQVRQRAEHRVRPALPAERHALARQPLEVAVFAHVHDRVRAWNTRRSQA